MLPTTALLLGVAFPMNATGGEPPPPVSQLRPAWELAGAAEERAEHLVPPLPRPLSKKEAWSRDKATRPDVHIGDRELARRRAPVPLPAIASTLPPPGTTVKPVTTLYNLWTHEALPIVPGLHLGDGLFHRFLRDHFTNQATRMDVRLIDVLAQVARRFHASRIDVVSGYRSPKYNLMLRKKGHQVARSSQHMEGHAVDFRIRGVPTMTLLRYVRSLRRGGVGYYPHSQFVHSDTGPVRFWKGS